MNENDYTTPPFEFLLLCNGIEIAKATFALTAQGGWNVNNLNVIGNGRYKSSTTQFRLRFTDTQYMGNGRLLTKVMCEIDALPVGWITPIVVDVSDEWLPGVPVAVLHWLKDTEVWSHGGAGFEPSGEFERFSLIVVKVETT